MSSTIRAAVATALVLALATAVSVSAHSQGTTTDELAQRVTDLERRVTLLEGGTPSPEPSPSPTAEPTPTPDPTPSPEAGDNLLSTQQSTFTGAVSWTPQGNAAVRNVAAPSVDGAGSLEITVDRKGPFSDDTPTVRTGTPQFRDAIAIEGAGDYAGSIMVRGGQEPVQARCEIRWYRGKNRILGTSKGDLTKVGSGWQDVSCAGTSPSRAERVALRVYIQGVDDGQIYHADQAILRPTSADGSEPTPEPIPTPDPTPTPQPTPTTPTTPGDFPDATTTGLSNPQAIDQRLTGKVVLRDGDTLENAEVKDGYIQIEGSNITVRNVWIHGRSGARYGIDANVDYTGNLFENVHIDGELDNKQDGIYGRGFTVRDSHIQGIRTGVMVVGAATVEGNYIHETWHNDTNHATSMSVHGGANIVIRGNNFRCDAPRGCSSALSLYGDVAPLDNILVEGNLFNANAAYCFKGGWSENKPFGTQITDVRVFDNHFGRALQEDCGRAGPYSNWNDSASGNEWSGNVWHDTGEPVGP